MLQMGHGENNTKKKMNFKFNAEHTFFTSDTHFNHANIISFCNRPFKDVEQMNEVMIANWNHVIGKDDSVFHLGDFCLGGAAEWTKILDRLNGKIYLIMGNHALNMLPCRCISKWANNVSICVTFLFCALKVGIRKCGNYSVMSTPERTIQEMTQGGFSISILPNMM